MPAAVVNHLHFKEPFSPELFAPAEAELGERMKEVEGFRAMHIVQVADDHAILVILADDADVLEQLATEIGSPWMVANVVQLLAAPPERHIGSVVTAVER